MEPIALHPIGIAHTPFPQSRKIPRQGGGPARIEVFEPYRPALQGLERCSHLWVLAFFHCAQRDVLHARPRKTSQNAKPRGVFSMRAPVRPNPLALSCARIVELLDHAVVVDRLDFQDQTPIVDLKPYSPGWDLIPSAASSHRYDPSRYVHDELIEALARDAEHALGPELAATSSIRSVVAGLAALVADHDIDLRHHDTRFDLPSADARVEVLLCATGAAFGNRRLTLRSCLPDETVLQVRVGSATYRIVEGGAVVSDPVLRSSM